MAVQAAITAYRQETINGFEQRRSLLSTAPTKEALMQGLNAVFLVASSGNAGAVTRGQDGDIPYGSPTNTQVTVTLKEKIAAEELTGFDVFASQGNQTQIMQKNTYATIARDQDKVILAELANATQDYGTASTILDLSTLLGAQAALGNNDVPIDMPDDMFCVISPGAHAYLAQTTEFANGQYVTTKPFDGGIARTYFRWMDINFIISTQITGKATSSELLYMFHRDALGYSCNNGEIMVDADFDRKQRKSWSNATIYHEAKILQDSGIIKITHDGSAFVTT